MNGPAADRETAAQDLLATTGGALLLATTLDNAEIPDTVRQPIVELAVARGESEIRDLFERFLPPGKRTRRLGTDILPEQILALRGDVEQGRRLFFESKTVQCRNCHQIAKTGSTLGPALDRIARQYKQPELLEQILEPSKKIDPKYVTWMVETQEGRIHTGLLESRSENAVNLRDSKDKRITIPSDEIEQLLPQQKSLMPELLLRDMTPEDVANLMAFLGTLK